MHLSSLHIYTSGKQLSRFTQQYLLDVNRQTNCAFETKTSYTELTLLFQTKTFLFKYCIVISVARLQFRAVNKFHNAQWSRMTI